LKGKRQFFLIVLLNVFFLVSIRCYAAGEDYVDVISDIDGITDVGIHSNFELEKAYDSSFDTLIEEDTGSAGSNTEDDIDTNTVNEDGQSDKGIETNFPNAQGTQLDSQYMNIQEEDTGGSSVDEWLNVMNYDLTYDNWTKVGTIPYLDTDDSSEIYTKLTDVWDGWYGFLNTIETGAGFSVNISILCYQAGAGESIEIVLDYIGGSGSSIGSVTPDSSYSYKTITLGGAYSANEINQMRIYVIYHKSGKGDNIYADHARLGISRLGGTNYEIDFEYGWQNADWNEMNEEVCIYVGSHTGSEILNINYWVGSWSSLGSITGTGWTNITATGLISSTYTIQLKGASESGDSSQDDWNIDLITLHTWTLAQPNYELNLEIQWQSADFDEQNEEVCITTGNFGGVEDIKVYEWDISGSQWVLLGILAANQWNNFTINYLTSSDYYVKYEGASETGDSLQDIWEIDAALINCYSPETTTTTTTTTTKSQNDPPKLSNNPSEIQFLILFACNAIMSIYFVGLIIKMIKKFLER